MQDNIPVPLDPWLASSLLQKAIRRGDLDHAMMAAMAFYTHRGQGIWRRLALIAVEDIGVANLPLVQRAVMLAADKKYRQAAGNELGMIFGLVTDMAAAAKDRSTDYLLSSAQDGGGELVVFRDWCFGKSPEALGVIAADAGMAIDKRAVAALCAVTSGPTRRLELGEPLLLLLDAFRDAGLPAAVSETALVAARLIKEPITILLLVAASAAQHLTDPVPVTEEVPPKPRLFRSIPTYCADRHTSIGKSAIRRWLVENQHVGDTISQYVQDFRAVDVAGYALFHVEGWAISNRWHWPLSRDLQQIGTRIDLEKSGCAPEGVEPVLAVVREELDHLNDIRCRLLERRPTPPRKPDLFGGEA